MKTSINLDLPKSLFIQLLGPLTSFLSMFVLTKAYSLELYGLTVLHKSLIEGANNFLSFRVNQTILKFCSEDSFLLNRISSLSILSGITNSLFSYFILKFVIKSDLSETFLFLLSLTPIIFQLNEILNGIIRLKKTSIFLDYLLIENTIRLLIVLSIFFTTPKFSILLVLIISLPTLVSLIIKLLLTEWRFEGKIIPSKSTYSTSELNSHILNYMASGSIKVISGKIDHYILFLWSTPEAIGVYQILKNLFSPLVMLSSALVQVEFREIISNLTKGLTNQAAKIVKEKTLALSFVAMPTGSLILLLHVDILNFFNKSTLEFNLFLPTMLLLIYSILNILSWWTGSYMFFYYPHIVKYTNLIIAINNIVVPFSLKHFFENTLSTLDIVTLSTVLSFLPSYLYGMIICLKKINNKISLNE
jgi:O-antigen/teichoic acid export membrane protein